MIRQSFPKGETKKKLFHTKEPFNSSTNRSLGRKKRTEEMA